MATVTIDIGQSFNIIGDGFNIISGGYNVGIDGTILTGDVEAETPVLNLMTLMTILNQETDPIEIDSILLNLHLYIALEDVEADAITAGNVYCFIGVSQDSCRFITVTQEDNQIIVTEESRTITVTC